MICHAGSNTVVAALALGLSSLPLPLGADQPWMADRCTALGVSRVLDPLTCTPSDAATTVHEVLEDGAARRSAEALGRRAAQLPTTAEAANLLERLGRPVG